MNRGTGTGETAAGSAWCDRYLVFAGIFHNPAYLFGTVRKYYRIGHTAFKIMGSIIGIGQQILRIGSYPVFVH
jgi:hypothetical protein